MSLFKRIWNKLSYGVHKLTYDPEAEKFAEKEKAKELDKEQREKTAQDTKKRIESEKKIKLEQKKKRDAKNKELKQKKEDSAKRNTFSIWRLIENALLTATGLLATCLVFLLAVWGSSLAINLNIYRSLPYRILYAIYGFVFFFVVIPYAMLYRWFKNGKKPRYYGLIPLIPHHIDNKFLAFFFSWLSYKPDEHMDDLKEWA